jgi:hypothetical protein
MQDLDFGKRLQSVENGLKSLSDRGVIYLECLPVAVNNRQAVRITLLFRQGVSKWNTTFVIISRIELNAN